MLKRELYQIKRDIAEAKTIDLTSLVEQRLDKTFNLYVSELQESYNRLLRRKDVHVLKRIIKEE